MKQYTYYFDDGTKSTVEVSEEIYEELQLMDDNERKANYNHNRHFVPLSAMTYEGEFFVDSSGDAYDELDRRATSEKIESAISMLTESQQELIRLVYIEGKSVNEVANIQGVAQSSISHRLMRIREKLKKLLG